MEKQRKEDERGREDLAKKGGNEEKLGQESKRKGETKGDGKN